MPCGPAATLTRILSNLRLLPRADNLEEVAKTDCCITVPSLWFTLPTTAHMSSKGRLQSTREAVSIPAGLARPNDWPQAVQSVDSGTAGATGGSVGVHLNKCICSIDDELDWVRTAVIVDPGEESLIVDVLKRVDASWTPVTSTGEEAQNPRLMGQRLPHTSIGSPCSRSRCPTRSTAMPPQVIAPGLGTRRSRSRSIKATTRPTTARAVFMPIQWHHQPFFKTLH